MIGRDRPGSAPKRRRNNQWLVVMGLERHTQKEKQGRRLTTTRSRRKAFSKPLTSYALQFRWADAISPEAWETYRQAIEALREIGIQFMLGGGFAMATFAGRWRDTKDIDFYIRPKDRDKVVAALQKAGFEDYYDRRPYDCKWIYRTVKDDVIVDIIWAMANQRARVDDSWFEGARSVRIRGEELLVLPLEEFMWCKFYILQRDHCDWTDIYNVLYSNGKRVDWDHLIERLEEDVALLKALLTVYRWLCPKASRELPRNLWTRLDRRERMFMPRPPKRKHIRLLDSRRWFAADLPKGHKLEV